MRRIDAGVEDRDHRAGAVVAGRPHLIALDERHAVGEHRVRDVVGMHGGGLGCVRDRRQASRTEVEGHVRHRLEPANHATAVGRQPSREARGGHRDRVPLRLHGRSGR